MRVFFVVLFTLGWCYAGIIYALNFSNVEFAGIKTTSVVVVGITLMLAVVCFQYAPCFPKEDLSRRYIIFAGETLALSGLGFLCALLVKFADSNAGYVDELGLGFKIVFLTAPWFRAFLIKPLLLCLATGSSFMTAIAASVLSNHLVTRYFAFRRFFSEQKKTKSGVRSRT
jgi:hypothetical protein